MVFDEMWEMPYSERYSGFQLDEVHPSTPQYTPETRFLKETGFLSISLYHLYEKRYKRVFLPQLGDRQAAFISTVLAL